MKKWEEKSLMRKLIIALAASASLLSGCTAEQANGWAAVMAASAKAGWDAGTEVTEARNEAEALRTARILAVEQQFAPAASNGEPTAKPVRELQVEPLQSDSGKLAFRRLNSIRLANTRLALYSRMWRRPSTSRRPSRRSWLAPPARAGRDRASP
jgi:hypothetical protein